MADEEGDGVVIGPGGPYQVTTKGFISAADGLRNRQDGLGLPSFNPKPGLPETTELTAMDQRILAALGFTAEGYSKVNTKE